MDSREDQPITTLIKLLPALLQNACELLFSFLFCYVFADWERCYGSGCCSGCDAVVAIVVVMWWL